MLENYFVIVIVGDQKTFKLAINIKTVKEILFTSIVVLTVMAVLLSLSGGTCNSSRNQRSYGCTEYNRIRFQQSHIR